VGGIYSSSEYIKALLREYGIELIVVEEKMSKDKIQEF